MQSGLYIVVGSLEGEDGTIIDFYLQRLLYNELISDADAQTFRLFGEEIEVHEAAAHFHDQSVESLTQVVGAGTATEAQVTLKPAGSEVLTALSEGGQFNHNCKAGFLPNLTQLQYVVSHRILHQLSPFRPLCPVCLGTELLDEQLRLRGLVDLQQLLDITPALDHVTKRNVALVQLGYQQPGDGTFDDREWGIVFEEADEETLRAMNVVRDPDGSLWQLPAAEATDASAVNVVTPQPTDPDAIASLPRKAFGELGMPAEDANCLVCQEAMESEDIVAEMPCSHVFHEQCIESWLAEQNMCPLCCFRLPAAEDEEEKEEASGGAGESTDRHSINEMGAAESDEVAEILLPRQEGGSGRSAEADRAA